MERQVQCEDELIALLEQRYIKDMKRRIPPKQRRVPERSVEMDLLMGREHKFHGVKKVAYVQIAYFLKHYPPGEVYNRITWVMPNSIRNNSLQNMDIRLTEEGWDKKPGRESERPSKEELEEMLVPGVSYSEVAKDIGVSPSTVASWCREYGIFIKKWINDIELKALMKKYGGSKKKVADHLNVPWWKVDRACKDFGFKCEHFV